MKNKLLILILTAPLLFGVSCRRKYEKGQVKMAENNVVVKSSGKIDSKINDNSENAYEGDWTTGETKLSDSDSSSYNVSYEETNSSLPEEPAMIGDLEEKEEKKLEDTDNSSKTLEFQRDFAPSMKAASPENDVKSKSTPGEIKKTDDSSKDSSSVMEKSVSLNSSLPSPAPEHGGESSPVSFPEMKKQEDSLSEVPVEDEFTFSGLKYRFTLTWEHWYIDNRVIYMRNEADGGRTMVMIEVMDENFSELSFRERTDLLKKYAENLGEKGYTEIRKTSGSDIMVLGNKGLRIEGMYEAEGLSGEAVIKIFTSGQRGYIVTILSSSKPPSEVKQLSDRIMDSIIRLN